MDDIHIFRYMDDMDVLNDGLRKRIVPYTHHIILVTIEYGWFVIQH